MLKQKLLHEVIPHALEEAVKEVAKYPRSPRIANQLFDAGMTLVKANDLFIPYFPHRAKVGYLPKTDNSIVGLLTYDRLPKIADRISVWLVYPEENYGVDILRVFKRHPFRVQLLQVSHGPFGRLGPQEWEFSSSPGLVGRVVASYDLE